MPRLLCFLLAKYSGTVLIQVTIPLFKRADAVLAGSFRYRHRASPIIDFSGI
jgi:hypothetical protein